MTDRKKVPSWERGPKDKVHSPDGIRELKESVKWGLQRKYKGIAESMFKYDLSDDRLQDMQVMSQDTVPETVLMRNGFGVWFEDPSTKQIHFLPAVMNGGVNIYGKMTSWSPVPVGYSDVKKGTYSAEIERIRNLQLNAENSVIMRNDLFGGNDEDFIDAMVNELVDNILTCNQLQLLASIPYIFNVTEDNLLSAKNYFLAICEHKPAIFINANGEKPVPATEDTQITIDPSLLELLDRWECQILEYIGFPCVPITKRAQQTVSEVSSNDDKIRIRREEKLNQRVKAAERIEQLFGININPVSLIDEYANKMQQAQKGNEEEMMNDVQ